MPVSLEEAKNNATNAVDVQVIDEFRKESVILDSLPFDDVVNPAGGGGVLSFEYRRLVTQPEADTRALNTEYAPQNVTTTRVRSDLAVMGGSFEVDRVIADIGPAASGVVQLNMAQKIKAARTKFQDLVINGDTDDDENGFDGLDKALRGSDTEINADGADGRADWSDLDSNASTKHQALDLLDDFLSVLDGTPTLILGNKAALAKVRAIVRRTGEFTRDPVDGLVGANGRPITREAYGGVIFADPGDKAGSNEPIIPLYDPDSSAWTVTVGAGADDGTFKLEVRVGARGSWQETEAIDHDAAAADVKAALEALGNVGENNTTVTGSAGGPFTIAFGGDLDGKVVQVRVSDQSVVDSGSAAVEVTATESATKGGLTDLYAVRIGMDGFHGLTTMGSNLVKTWLPDFSSAGAVKKGEVELGPVGVALRATKAAAVLRGIRVR